MVDEHAAGRSRRVVAIVASAGGLKAVSSVLTALPRSFDAPIVVLIHQDPARVSELPSLLTSHTPLDVVHASDGDALWPARVLVAPPGRHTLVTGQGRIMLIASGAAPPSRPSADLLLTSLALAVEADAIAVVLSGGGHDGATGATAVRHVGGTVIASDEASSSRFSMPSATIERDSAIDHVVPLGEIAALLADLCRA
jgi:two-component system chemotaxis response regulator CheB